MLVKTNISLASHLFDLPHGTEIDSEEFASLIGTGWEALCDPIEVADKEEASETADNKPFLRRGRQR